VPDASEQVRLSACTTLRLGGPAARFSEASTGAEVVAAVREADQAGEPLLVLGGGSNLVVSDAGFAGLVARVATRGIAVRDSGDQVRLLVQAGENWAELVDWAVDGKLSGIECLAGIPGLAGATPIQNVGAYGQEIAQVIDSVLVYDRESGHARKLTAADCAFGYRTSIFKRKYCPRAPRTPAAGRLAAGPTGRYVVLAVALSLPRGARSAPVRYAELAGLLGVRPARSSPTRSSMTAGSPGSARRLPGVLTCARRFPHSRPETG
jgi:UDP-N-acetylmuramate dehydrogenase